MAGKLKAIGIAWFRQEDYQRIREISDDRMIPTFEEFETKMEERLARFKTQGILMEKVIVDSDELLAFARKNGSEKINSQVRSQFASWLVATKFGTDH